jgi:hypothetical protein
VKERPIIFSAPMVRAILDGTKTVTRRVVTPQPHRVDEKRINCAEPGDRPIVVTQPAGWEWRSLYAADDGGHFASGLAMQSPYGLAGDRLWVKETFTHITGNGIRVHFHADGEPIGHDGKVLDTRPGTRRWMPSIFMPRKISRILLEVVSVRAERLHDITEDDARREGVERHDDDGVTYYGPLNRGHACAKIAFERIWDEINGERAAWSTNPWVWRVEFKRLDCKARAA